MAVPVFIRKHSLNAATVGFFGIAIWRLGFSPELPAVLVFIFGGVLLAVIDWRVQRLPSKIIYLTLAGVLAGLAFASIVQRDWVPLATAVTGGLLFTNAFFLVWLFTTKATGMVVLGFGDVRLAGLLGVVLGWYGLQFVLYGAIVGHLLAFAIIVATSIRGGSWRMQYSFGPPLIAGTLAVVLFSA